MTTGGAEKGQEGGGNNWRSSKGGGNNWWSSKGAGGAVG